MRTKYFIKSAILIAILMFCVNTVVAGGKWSAKGIYVEGCSCNAPCPCQLVGFREGCYGVNVLSLQKGSSYKNVNLAGTKIAFATTPGEWVRLYVDTKDDEQKEAAFEFAESIGSPYGEVESIETAEIELTGEDGKYTAKVNKGKIMELTTEPVIGGDNKNPVTYINIHSELNPILMQGKTISASYRDGEKEFELKDSNSYFNNRMKSKGKFE